MSVIQDVIAMVLEKDPGQPEFHQAVKEVLTTLEPTVSKHPEFVKARIFERTASRTFTKSRVCLPSPYTTGQPPRRRAPIKIATTPPSPSGSCLGP